LKGILGFPFGCFSSLIIGCVGFVQELPEFLPHMTLNPKPLKTWLLKPDAFLANTGVGRTIVELKSGQTLFCQGEPAGAVYYLQRGKVKIAVLSKGGKEATIALLSSGSFLGEECIAGPELHRKATAMALTPVRVLKIERGEMIRGLREEHQFGNDSAPETVIPKISQETLAEMVGITRSRVSFFMNRFRKQGFIEYNGKISVRRLLLNLILHD
jgi:CRP/FNR family transcriptional regulator, cyclic AMP receptor protein